MTLTKAHEAQIRASAGNLNTAEVQDFRTRVIDRLEKLLESGVVIATPHVASACTAELMRAK